jgi:hypothetical protein
MKTLLSAATFGLLPSPLPHVADLDRQLMANLRGSQPRLEGETTEGEPYEDEGPMRLQSAQGGRADRVVATADAAKAR